MFCSNCGAKLREESKFCSSCGVPVVTVPQSEAEIEGERMAATAEMMAVAETAAALAPAYNTMDIESVTTAAQPAAKSIPRRRIRLLTWLLPAISLIIVAALVSATFFYQMSVNRQVDRLLQEGEKLALDGKLAEGKAMIDKALRKRPDHRVLLADRALLTDAISLQDSLSDADKQGKSKKFDDALKAIDKLKAELATRTGPVFEKLAAGADEKKEQIVVAQVSDAIPIKKTVEELVPLLHTVQDYKSDDAKKSAKQITQKIADISYDKASKELTDKQFAEALSTIEGALKFDASNSKLTTLKTTVEQKKKAFEDAENKRIQQAIEAATQEDIKNRTQAVELVTLDSYTDADGYFIIQGSVKNKATRSISSVLLYFEILDQNGNSVGTDSVYVSPYFLDVGDTGTFYTNYYNYGDLSSVNVTRVEWLLN